MRKGFTLIELLVVVGIMLTLMGIVFRLADIEAESKNRYTTIQRMQRLENCLGGYYAAFGCYPPVTLHGSRNIYLRASGGVQSDETVTESQMWSWDSINTDKPDDEEHKAWECVQAACRSQPVRCSYPFPEKYETDSNYWDTKVKNSFKDIFKRKIDGNSKKSEKEKSRFGADVTTGDPSWFSSEQRDKQTDWRNVQLFQFGVMSFLLPRYLVMLDAKEEYYTFKQWTDNNPVPCNPLNGKRNFGLGTTADTHEAWKAMCAQSKVYNKVGRVQSEGERLKAFTEVANIPSQAVCARWMPYLEGICTCNRSRKFFGVNIRLSDDRFWDSENVGEIHSPLDDGKNYSTSSQYALDGITVEDGWGEDFYYYSPSPHQSYTLWSSGKNKRTFPPWISRDTLTEKANKCVTLWVEDDIMSMSN